ncbi:hypothetical protein [Nostoc sp. PCC 9305]|uniref:hypothetical protein n=1 Tax=Nostoc sp. PCC 9305 TaxID=296636 RepID=UPI0039C61FE2
MPFSITAFSFEDVPHSCRKCCNTWADVLNRANLGIEVMHERNAHNFPLDLAAGEAVPVATMSTTGYAYASVIHG